MTGDMTLAEAIEESRGTPHDLGDPRWNEAIDVLRDHAGAAAPKTAPPNRDLAGIADAFDEALSHFSEESNRHGDVTVYAFRPHPVEKLYRWRDAVRTLRRVVTPCTGTSDSCSPPFAHACAPAPRVESPTEREDAEDNPLSGLTWSSYSNFVNGHDGEGERRVVMMVGAPGAGRARRSAIVEGLTQRLADSAPPLAAVRDQTAGAAGQDDAAATATLTDVEATLALLDNVVWSDCEPSSFTISDGDRHVSYDRDNFARLLLGMPMRPVEAPACTLAVGDSVRTADELDRLPVGTVVRDAAHDVCERQPVEWIGVSKARGAGAHDSAVVLPARILDLPADRAPATDGGAS